MILANKSTIYAILRYDGVRDVVCCFTNGLDYAEDLKGQYEQQWLDSGGTSDEVVFHIQGNTFYES